MSTISIIIPFYFNELNVAPTTDELVKNESRFPDGTVFEYVFVDDGSKDNTLAELRRFKSTYKGTVKIVKLSGNFGSYNAILAGMQYATGDCNVVITADLQDPPELIVKMYDYWCKGVKLVLANREQRSDGFFTSLFANLYHKLIKKYALKNVPEGGFDFCLFDAQLRDQVVAMKEKNTNSLYLLAWLNYDYVSIAYTRRRREIGKSRWTLAKRIKLFIDSFVSFSYLPLRLITVGGLLLGSITLLYAVYVLFARLTGLITLQGWSTIMVVFLLVSSFQAIAVGIIGEYLWRNLEHSRNRPAYVVDEVID